MSDSHQEGGSSEKLNGVETSAGRSNSKRYRMSSSSSSSDDSDSSRHRYSYRDYNRRETAAPAPPASSSSSSSRHAKTIPAAHSSSSRYEKSRSTRHNDHVRKYSSGQDRQQQQSADVAAPMNLDLSTSNDSSSVTTRIQNRLGRKHHQLHQQDQQQQQPAPPQLPPLDALTKELLNNLMYSSLPLATAAASYVEPYNPMPLKGCPNSMPMYVPSPQTQHLDSQQMQMDGMQARNSLIYVPTQERDGNNSAGGGTAPHYHQHQHVKRPRYENSNNNNNFHRNQQNTNLMISPIPYLENPVQSINEHFGRFGRLTKVVIEPFTNGQERAFISYANHQEAVAARRSADPFLNNRFIEVLWDNRRHNKHGKDGGATNFQSFGGGNVEQQQQQPPAPERPKFIKLTPKQREERSKLQTELNEKMANVQLLKSKLSDPAISTKQQGNIKNMITGWMEDVCKLKAELKKFEYQEEPKPALPEPMAEAGSSAEQQQQQQQQADSQPEDLLENEYSDHIMNS